MFQCFILNCHMFECFILSWHMFKYFTSHAEYVQFQQLNIENISLQCDTLKCLQYVQKCNFISHSDMFPLLKLGRGCNSNC